MITQKKKIIKESKIAGEGNNKNGRNDKCPKDVKDCLKCKIVDCPEER
jgi:hypothetical protein